MHMEARSQPQAPSALFPETGSHLELARSASWLLSEPQRSTTLHLSTAWGTRVRHDAWLFAGFSRNGAQVLMANALQWSHFPVLVFGILIKARVPQLKKPSVWKPLSQSAFIWLGLVASIQRHALRPASLGRLASAVVSELLGGQLSTSSGPDHPKGLSLASVREVRDQSRLQSGSPLRGHRSAPC